ncbi:MAG: outer membrane lipoprotein chaperone LolA, partial [Gammaproteobacteria bacterium]
LTAVAAMASDISPETGMARVQAFLDEVDTLRAHFRQTVEDAEGRLVQSSSGVLTIARPDRFRWDYAEPYEQLVLADGERLWLYDADLEQVTVRELDASLASTPAMLLSGGGRVSDAFRAGEVLAPGGEALSVELVPLDENSDFQSVTVHFEGEKLVRMTLEDALGQSTRIAFSDIERNVPLGDATFAFEPPEGVDVIGATAP